MQLATKGPQTVRIGDGNIKPTKAVSGVLATKGPQTVRVGDGNIKSRPASSR